MRFFKKRPNTIKIHDYENSIPIGFVNKGGTLVRVPDGYTKEQFDAFRAGYEYAQNERRKDPLDDLMTASSKQPPEPTDLLTKDFEKFKENNRDE